MAAKIGPVRRLRRWVRHAERDQGQDGRRQPYSRSVSSPLLTGAPGVLLQTRMVLSGVPAGSSLRC
jgi:hypothetical protein